jgi:hypothetical protein
VRRVGVDDEACLLEQLPAQCREWRLARLDAAAGGRPNDRCSRRHRWMREAEAAQQDTMVVGQDDCANRTSQARNHPWAMSTKRE